MSGLVADPTRQANDPLRGYIYQILRSIVVWLELADDEELYLEGAEDLDRIKDSEALTEQVKDTAGSGNITLRTASVVDAINHFWQHTARNPSVTLHFRYLTTSDAGVERGAPFGPGQAGLDTWNELAAMPGAPEADAGVKTLVGFLLSEGKVDQPVREFLLTASTQQVLDRLIIPIEWVTGQNNGNALVREIKDRLVTHGAPNNVAPADAEAAFDALYTAAFDAAVKTDEPPLNRAQFLRIFAGATAIQLPKSDLRALIAAAMAPNQADAIALQIPRAGFEGTPPLPARHFRRVTQEQRLAAALNGGCVLLHGSTGTGKTLVAASHLRGSDAFWLPLRDLDQQETRSKLNLAVENMRAEGIARTLVVDDLDATADPRLIEASLASLWRCQCELGGKLILTSDRPLPARLAQAVGIVRARELPMEPFDRAEIEAFLKQSNCPPENIAIWGGILEMSTVGHPQLINARIATLEETGFQEASAEDLLGTTTDVDRIRFEARRLIAKLPPGPRELLYRTSLVTGRLTRQHLMAIARIGDAVNEPGEAIDLIAGPWLEETDDKAFRVSPLAKGAAEDARGTTWIKSMHGKVAWTYLMQRTLTPWDVSSILMHCYISGSAGPLMYILQSLLSANKEAWSAIAKACDIFTQFGLATGEGMPFTQAPDLFIFRLFQYRIAAEIEIDLATRIAAKIDEEFERAPLNESTIFFRFIFLSQALSLTELHCPVSEIVRRGDELLSVVGKMEKIFPKIISEIRSTAREETATNDFASFAGLRLVSQIQSIDDLQNAMQALLEIPSENARAIIESIGGAEDMSSFLIERTWLAENNSLNNWPEYCEKLRSSFNICAQVGAISMARGIAPVLIRTINENLGDPAAAMDASDDLQNIVGDDPMFQCALAKVANEAGDFPKALAIWQEALPRWPNPGQDIGAAFAFRTAAIASANNNNWTAAAGFFDSAHSLTKFSDRPTFALGLTMDAAFCRFMCDDQAAAVTGFGAVVSALIPMQADQLVEPALSLQRRAAGILTSLADGERTEAELKKFIGLCSNLDPFVTDAPAAPPLDMLRISLIELELAHGSSLDCSLREAPRLRSSPFTTFRSTSAESLFKIAQRARDFTETVGDGLRQLDALAMASEQVAKGVHDALSHYDGRLRPWPEGADELLIGKMIVAVFDLAAADELDQFPLEQWRSDAGKHPNAGRIVSLIDHLEGLFFTGAVDAWTTTIGPATSDWSTHISSALAATLFDRPAPDALLACHGLWTHYFTQPGIRMPAAQAVATLVERDWRRMVKFPANLGLPPIPLRALRAALADPSFGWSKTRVVLQAALEVIALPEGDQTRVAIENMVD